MNSTLASVLPDRGGARGCFSNIWFRGEDKWKEYGTMSSTPSEKAMFREIEEMIEGDVCTTISAARFTAAGPVSIG